jgi:hypothetical protein
MNANTRSVPQIVSTPNGWQYPGRRQWPMDREQQKKSGFLANNNISISGRPVRGVGR